jgi:hypothetical protein
MSFSNMRGSYGLNGEYYEPQKPKEAFIEGFTTIPLFTLVIVGYFVAAMLAGAILLGLLIGAVWVFTHMP